MYIRVGQSMRIHACARVRAYMYVRVGKNMRFNACARVRVFVYVRTRGSKHAFQRLCACESV
jgi:hypothetical protein